MELFIKHTLIIIAINLLLLLLLLFYIVVVLWLYVLIVSLRIVNVNGTLQIPFLLFTMRHLLPFSVLFQLVFCLDGINFIPCNSIWVFQYAFYFDHFLWIALKFEHITIVMVLFPDIQIIIINKPFSNVIVLPQLFNL